MRELLIQLRRDAARDSLEGDVSFRGFRFYWPDGVPVRTGLSRFCGAGTSLLFGRRQAVPEACLLRLCCVSTSADAPFTRPVPRVRVRRVYLLREGPRGVLHFHNGVRTELVFEDGVDEPAVLRWVGLDGLPDGGRLWLDVFALPAGSDASPGGQEPAAGLVAPRAGTASRERVGPTASWQAGPGILPDR
jgi:hypothetical protein